MSDKEQRIGALIDAIVAFLEANREAVEAADLTLQRIETVDRRRAAFANIPSQGSRHDAVLRTAIANINDPRLNDIRQRLEEAKDDLVWNEDEMKYYPSGSDLGEGYVRCNLHTLLIGPGACGFHHDDFTLGLFMLGPRTLYRDHQHKAPETYVNLSPCSGWRLAGGDWEDQPAGSIIFNPPHQVHATRVYADPFLSVFSWLEDISSQCAVVPRDDWALIERQLAQ